MTQKFNSRVSAEGALLIADAVAKNTKMSFLKAYGSTTEFSDDQLAGLTDKDLTGASHNQTGHISNVAVDDATSTVHTEIVLDGNSVEADYGLNSILIVATVDGNEHLFAVLKANQVQYMNAYDGKSSTNLQINCSFKISNTDVVDIIKVDTAGTLTRADYDKLHEFTVSQVAVTVTNVNKYTDTAMSKEAAARSAADSAEIKARSDADAWETGQRTAADTTETKARIAADNAAASSVSKLTSTVAANYTSATVYADSAVAAEASTRSTADSAESKTRSDADLKETQARANGDTANSSAISAEATARSNADSDEVVARNAAIAATKTEVTTLAGQVASTISAVKGGGINLVPNSDFALDNLSILNNPYTVSTNQITRVTLDDVNCAHVTGMGKFNSSGGGMLNMNLKIGDVISYQLLIKGAKAGDIVYFGMQGSRITRSKKFTLTTGWQLLKIEGEKYDNDNPSLRIYSPDGVTNADFYVTKLKIEKNPYATSWSAAPEDKADDNAVVHNSGDETVAGIKNFTGTLQANGKQVATYDQINPWHIINDAGHDLNNVMDDGRYWLKEAMTNSPTSNWAYLYVNAADSTRVQQEFVADTTGDMYIRIRTGTTWSEWKQVTFW